MRRSNHGESVHDPWRFRLVNTIGCRVGAHISDYVSSPTLGVSEFDRTARYKSSRDWLRSVE